MCLLKLIFPCAIILVRILPGSFAAIQKGKIVCYYNGWTRRESIIPAHVCTHVIYSFIGLDEKRWRWKFLDGDNEFTNHLQEFLNLRIRFPRTKFLIAIGGGYEGSRKYSEMAEIPTRRRWFIESIVDFLSEYLFDGLDFDWEYPGADWTGGRAMDKQTFPLLMQELRTALNRVGRPLELTMAVSISEYVVNLAYDVPTLCNIVDAVHLMAYDLRGPWDKYADVHSPIHARRNEREEYRKLNIDYGGAVWFWAGCPARKLVLGVPFYGREFVVRGRGRPGALIDRNATYRLPYRGDVRYDQLCKRFADRTWTRYFDNEVGVPYMIKGNRFLGYDDVHSLRLKADWIKRYGFGGVMIWAIEEDDYDGSCGSRAPLISTLYANLKNYYIST